MSVTPDERTCSLCRQPHCDTTTSYCRPCTNAYNAWRYRQKRKGLPTTVTEYRLQTEQYLYRDIAPGMGVTRDDIDPDVLDKFEARTRKRGYRIKDCPICFAVHSNPHSTYCGACKSGYEAWARRQRSTYRKTDGRAGRARPTVEEYAAMVHDMNKNPRTP